METFVAEINGVQEFGWFTPTALDPLNNNGTGFSDWQLDGFDLTSFLDDDVISFGLDMTNVSGGQDQFFTLIGQGRTVPEPSILVLMSLLVAGLTLARKKNIIERKFTGRRIHESTGEYSDIATLIHA